MDLFARGYGRIQPLQVADIFAAQEDIDKNVARLREENRNLRFQQEKMAFTLSKLSPVSAFQLAAMELAGTDVGIKARYEDGLTTYRAGFNEYKRKKQLENGGLGGLRITVDSKDGVKIDTGREIALDLSDLPEYRRQARSMETVVAGVIPNLTLLAVLSLLAFTGAFVAFLRYDVR